MDHRKISRVNTYFIITNSIKISRKVAFYSNNYSYNVFLASTDAVPSTNQIETTDAIKHDKVYYKPGDDDQEEQQ